MPNVLKIIKAFFTKHPCFNKKKRPIKPRGILVHSTGSVNRELRRYVDCEEHLGRNQYNNHWNKATATKSVHAFIGYDKNKEVIVAETLPHDIACWGCGGDKKGSYNYDPHAFLQFEICQGSNSDADYYWKAIKVAEDYCVHLCKMYGWTADNITSHKEAHAAGYASNHGDPQSWMVHFGDNMNKFRARVQAALDGDGVTVETAPEKAPETPADAPVVKDEQIPVPEAGGATAGKNGGKTCMVELNVLKSGSKGSQVKTLQRLLNAIGYSCGDVDGSFGPKTKAAVKKFQKVRGLEVDGCCGPLTWAAVLTQC